MIACLFRNQGGCSHEKAQAHHVVPQQRIKRAHKTALAAERRGGPKAWSLTAALRDGRNLVGLCKRHHEKVTNGLVHLDPPAEAFMFAEEIGLQGSLEADLLRRVA